LCIFHIISLFNLPFFQIFHTFSIGTKVSWIVKRYGKYGRKIN
jgi:hypothetical protein